jgi:hypothetical protein
MEVAATRNPVELIVRRAYSLSRARCIDWYNSVATVTRHHSFPLIRLRFTQVWGKLSLEVIYRVFHCIPQ